MADMSFDVVFAGGGYGALMSAPYFCMNGMSVGIFEGLPELGGGHASDSMPVPGFTGNPHAHAMVAQLAPQLQDFKLWKYGGFLRLPEDILSYISREDRKGVKIKYAEKYNMEKGAGDFNYAIFEENYENLARMSKKDADICKDLVQKMLTGGWLYAVMMDWLNPPPPYGEQEWMEKLYTDKDCPLDPRLQYLTCAEISRELFEDRRFQMFFTRLNGMMGFWPDRLMSPLMVLLQASFALGLGGAGYWEGGTHQIVHVLQRLLGELGAKSYVDSEVDKIIVENGRAKGIRLANGAEIEAKKFVVTNVDPRQLTFRFLRDVNISELIKRKLRNLTGDVSTLFWGWIAHHEPAKYYAEEFCPGIGKSFSVVMGDDDMDYIEKLYRADNQAIRPGKWPSKMYFWAGNQTLHDPRMSPPGKYNTIIEELGPPASAMSEREWQQVKREVGPRMVEEWRKFAPNMTDDNIIGINIETPGDFVRRDSTMIEGSWQMGVSPAMHQWGRYRPIPEYARYTVPGVEGLYCTGIGWHSNFGSPAGFAYNMYKQCAWDHGLRQFWKEAGRDW
jgi:phytoene dehydrogenase-like protein